MRRTRTKTTGFVGMVALLATMIRPLSLEAAEVDVAAILKVWRGRQDSTKSIEFEWTDRAVITKGHVSRMQQLLTAPAERKGLPEGDNPPEDLVDDRPVKLLLEGDKLRYSYEEKIWFAEEKRYVTNAHTSAFDGETSLNYHGPNGLSTFPTAVIYAEKWNSDAGIYHHRALLMRFRPFDFRMSRIDTGHLRMLDQQAVVQGRNCWLLEQTSGSSDRRVQYYVDSLRDFSIVRFTEETRGRLECKIDISYTQDKKDGWVPDGWSFVWSTPAGPETITAKVNRYAINPVLEVERFRVQFPPGTWVTDSRSSPSGMYLVKEDGKTRPIPRSEAGASYEQLWNSEPGEAFLQPRNRSVSWWWALGVGCLFATGLVLIWWKRLKSSTLRSPPGKPFPDAK